MIQVTYNRKAHKLTVKGHAESGEKGHDLVCAATSILTYTMAASVANMAAAKQARFPVMKLEEGDAVICCKPLRHYKKMVMLIFDSICAGFELLQTSYPDNITYEIKV